MRPTGEEVLRGVQNTLMTFVLPEVQSAYARTELMYANALLGIAASEWDGAAQRLVDDNAALRELARRAADALAGAPDAELVEELRSLAGEADASLGLSDLSAANERLRYAVTRVALFVQGRDAPALRALRAEIIRHFQAQAEARSLSLLGPRADG